MPDKKLLLGGNIANIERVEVIPDGGPEEGYLFETSTSCTFNASVSAGTETEQRSKNVILGVLKTEDIVKGYDIELEDQRLIMDVMAIVDGGKVTGEGEEWTKYESPVAGSIVTRKSFTLNLYTSDRDTSGDAVKYYKWSFAGCKGTPVSGGATDGQFTTLKYSIKSRPKNGTSPMVITKEDKLPGLQASEAA